MRRPVLINTQKDYFEKAFPMVMQKALLANNTTKPGSDEWWFDADAKLMLLTVFSGIIILLPEIVTFLVMRSVILLSN